MRLEIANSGVLDSKIKKDKVSGFFPHWSAVVGSDHHSVNFSLYLLYF